MSNIIGFITKIQGSASVTLEDGSIKYLAVGDPIHEGETFKTIGQDSSIQVTFNDGRTLDVGGDETIVADESVYDGEPFADADVLAVQEALLSGEGFEFEETAAGGEGGENSGAEDAYTAERTGAEGEYDPTGNPNFAGAGPAAFSAGAPLNQAPIANDDFSTDDGAVAARESGYEDEGAVATGNVLSNDTDDGLPNPDNDLDVVAVNGIAVTGDAFVEIAGTYGTLFLNPETGAYEYHVDNDNPDVDQMTPDDFLKESFSYTVSDGDKTDTATLTITINGSNDAPVAVAEDDFTVYEDGYADGGEGGGGYGDDFQKVSFSSGGGFEPGFVFEGQVEATDVDRDDDSTTLTYSLEGEGPVGLTFNEDGSYEFDPSQPDYQYLAAGESTTVSFTWIATDRHGAPSEPDTVDITILGTNDQPTILPVAVSAVETIDTYARNGLDDDHSQKIHGELNASDLDASDNHTFDIIDTYAGEGEGVDDQIIWDWDFDGGGLDLRVNVVVESADIDPSEINVKSMTLHGDWGHDSNVPFTLTGDFNALGVGQEATVTLKYTATDTSEHQSPGEPNESDPNFITITVSGTNDQPEVRNVCLRTQDEAGEGLNTFTGTLAASDDDATDINHTFEIIQDSTKVTSYEKSGRGWRTRYEEIDVPIDDPKIVLDPNTGEYTVTGDFNALAVGEIAVVKFQYTADDGHNIQITNPVTGEISVSDPGWVKMTIVGTNDAPIIETGTNVYFESENAGYNNVLVAYELVNGVPANPSIVVMDTNSGHAQGEFMAFYENASVNNIHFAIIANGQTTYPGIAGAVLDFDTSGTYPVLTIDETPGAPVYFDQNEFNTDGHDYFDVTDNGDGTLTVNMEDLPLSGPDNDRDDLVVSLSEGGTDGSVEEIADGADGENVDILSTEGSFSFDDVDFNDTHDVDFTTGGQDYLGTFTPTIVNAATGDEVGKVSWTFEVPDADVDFLAKGETIEQTYTVSIDDGNGGIATQDITVTLVGTNDAPEIVALDNIVAGSVTEIIDGAEGENEAILSTDGEFFFDDVDLTDDQTISSVSEGGENYLGTFTYNLDNDATGNDIGKVSWEFTVPDAVLDSMDEGDTIVQTYTVTIDDGNGGTASQDITVTIEGTDDATPPTVEGETYNYRYDLRYSNLTATDDNDTLNVGDDIYRSTVNMGDGDDTVNVDDDIYRSTVNMGDGDDTVNVDDDIERSTVNMGAGDDTVTVNDDIERSTVNMGAGDDTLTIGNDNDFRYNARVNMGEDTDTLILTDNSIDIHDLSDHVRDVETIQLGGSNPQTLNDVRVEDVIRMTDDDNILKIDGDGSDTVDLSNSGPGGWESASNFDVGSDYTTVTSTSGDIQILIDNDIDIV